MTVLQMEKLLFREKKNKSKVNKSKSPVYVSAWDVESKAAKHIEVIYVGTHEKVPY